MDGLKFFPKRRWNNHSKETRKTYQSWCSMRHRCYNPKNISYPHYGGRGIQVCLRWRDNYDAFVEDMGLRPDGMTLDRLDSEKDYFPGNCQWATKTEQNRNKRSVRKYEMGGRSLSIAEWAREYGQIRQSVAYRLNAGRSIEQALGLG